MDYKLSWQEHIRKRPGMYLGSVNHNGLVNFLKNFIGEIIEISKCDQINFEFSNHLIGKIEILGIKKTVNIDLALLDIDNPKRSFELPSLNALSSQFQIDFINSGALLESQLFIRGVSNKEINKNKLSCTNIQINFDLDKEIWGEQFKWKFNYLSHEIREFSYLHSSITFKITENHIDKTNTNTYNYPKGLYDRLEIEILNCMGMCFFKHHHKIKLNDFEIEIAYAFRSYAVDQPYIKTFANNKQTPEHGSHLDAILQGLTHGTMMYFQAQNLIDKYKISEKGIRNRLLCIANVKYTGAIFSGCVKHKLANPEIIEPIAQYIAGELYESIKMDEESTKYLISQFEIERYTDNKR